MSVETKPAANGLEKTTEEIQQMFDRMDESAIVERNGQEEHDEDV